MEKGHSQNIDQRPKRRIDKDNPYRLFTVGAATSEPHYFIQFKDGTGTEHCLEIYNGPSDPDHIYSKEREHGMIKNNRKGAQYHGTQTVHSAV